MPNKQKRQTRREKKEQKKKKTKPTLYDELIGPSGVSLFPPGNDMSTRALTLLLWLGKYLARNSTKRE